MLVFHDTRQTTEMIFCKSFTRKRNCEIFTTLIKTCVYEDNVSRFKHMPVLHNIFSYLVFLCYRIIFQSCPAPQEDISFTAKKYTSKLLPKKDHRKRSSDYEKDNSFWMRQWRCLYRRHFYLSSNSSWWLRDFWKTRLNW